MLSRRLPCALFALALLAGCATDKPAGSAASSPAASGSGGTAAAPAGAPPERCSSEPLADLVGKPGSLELLEQARQRAGAQRARMLTPDDMVTLEYDSQRLNIYLDEQDKVRMASCG